MNKSVRLKSFTSVFATLIALPLLGAGCSEDNPISDLQEGLCCESFQVGADLSKATFGLEGEIQGHFRAFAQAAADLSAIATATVEDVRIACENMARDMNADDAGIAKAEGLTGADALDAWCTLAQGQISARFSGGGELNTTLKIQATPPSCQVQAHVAASCEANCKVDASCEVDIQAVTCEGGTLVVECSGTCEPPSATASVSCTGSCEGSCEGSCKATVQAPQVECQGTCEGTCSANAQGTGNGLAADGTCSGFCDGTCTATPGTAMAMCEGSCQGSCQGSCTAEAGVKFDCDGQCDVDFEAPRCEGGSIQTNCEANAECKANCDASASAKAECRPGSVDVVVETTGTLTAEAQAEVDLAVASIRANVPTLLIAVQGRGEAFLGGVQAAIEAGEDIAANIDLGDVSVEAALCAAPVGEALVDAQANFTVAINASVDVTSPLLED